MNIAYQFTIFYPDNILSFVAKAGVFWLKRSVPKYYSASFGLLNVFILMVFIFKVKIPIRSIVLHNISLKYI